MKKISIVIPVYYNAENLLPLYNDLKEKVLTKLNNLDYEIVLVDDGSKDNSYAVMQEIAKLDSKIVLIKLARNFGEHAATLAGLSKCTGDFAVRKAADLQEPSELILEMIEKYNEGNKVVLALRKSRNDKWHEKFLSNIYTNTIQKFALKNMPEGGVDSYLIDRQVIDFLKNLNQNNLPLTELILWSGYEYASVYYDRQKRTIGKSRWTLSKKIKMTFDSLLGFSYIPIRFITSVGFFAFLISVIWAFVLIIQKITGNITIDGYTSIIILLLVSFGIIMLSIGIVGEYVWRALDAAKHTPPFIIDTIKKGDKNE